MIKLFLRWLGYGYLGLWGWKLEGATPSQKKYIIIAAPHTSNWDVPLMLAMAAVYGIRVRWIVKSSLFWPPLGWLLKALGGVPVDRSARHNVVDQIAGEFARHERFVLLITPEGTRSRSEYWKTGFYHMAQRAQVPLVLGFLDFKRKRGGLTQVLHTTGDLDADIEVIRAYYEGRTAKYPECFGPVRVRPREEREATENGPQQPTGTAGASDARG